MIEKMIKCPMTKTSDQCRGFTLVEVVVASAIILVSIVSVLGVYTLYFKTAVAGTDAVKAAYLGEEGVEAVRYLRDVSWSTNIESLSLNTPYGIAFYGGSWQASTTAKWVDGFERTVTLSAVYRDASDDIVTSLDTLDPDTRLVVSSVSWVEGGATTTKSISTYITDLWQN